jgi:hypothetical protein
LAGFFIANSDPSTIKDRTNTGSDEDGRLVNPSTVLLESFEVRGAGKPYKLLAPTQNLPANDLQITLGSRENH